MKQLYEDICTTICITVLILLIAVAVLSAIALDVRVYIMG
jgi:hypothetical protein